MMEGKPPFRAASEYLTFEKILALDYKMPSNLPEDVQALIRSLLDLEPKARLGDLIFITAATCLGSVTSIHTLT